MQPDNIENKNQPLCTPEYCIKSDNEQKVLDLSNFEIDDPAMIEKVNTALKSFLTTDVANKY